MGYNFKEGTQKADGFDGIHGKGVSITAAVTTGTTAVDVLSTTTRINGTVTGVWVVGLDSTAANIILKTTAGTVATIAKGTTVGGLVASATLSNTAITREGILTVESSVADPTGIAGGQARVYVTYKVAS